MWHEDDFSTLAKILNTHCIGFELYLRTDVLVQNEDKNEHKVKYEHELQYKSESLEFVTFELKRSVSSAEEKSVVRNFCTNVISSVDKEVLSKCQSIHILRRFLDSPITLSDDTPKSTTYDKEKRTITTNSNLSDFQIIRTENSGITADSSLFDFDIFNKVAKVEVITYIDVVVETININCDDITCNDIESIIGFYGTRSLNVLNVEGKCIDALECNISGWTSTKNTSSVVFKKTFQ